MVKVKTVENQIWKREGVHGKIVHESGRDMRSDRNGLPSYGYARRAKGSMTVAQLRRTRFATAYPGLRLEVYDGMGNPAQGNLTLDSLRETYSA